MMDRLPPIEKIVINGEEIPCGDVNMNIEINSEYYGSVITKDYATIHFDGDIVGFDND